MKLRQAAWTALCACLALAGCAGGPVSAPPPSAATATATSGWLDATPRVAVISAFEPELALLRQQLQGAQRHRVNGVDFHTGTLQGTPVVLFLSGISMTNAAMNTQLALDRFRVSHIVFSGIAGGVNPQLHIGDVAVPAQWGQYLEVLMAREIAPGQYQTRPGWMDTGIAPYGMLFPRPVGVQSQARPEVHKKFWFEADAAMLAAARAMPAPALSRCDTAGQCLGHSPQLLVGGNGVSGPAFVDNAAFREYTYATFQAHVLDMETAAVAAVAYSNAVPYIAFRSLSDLAGGGAGENQMHVFFQIAADNSAKVLLAFLAQWKP